TGIYKVIGAKRISIYGALAMCQEAKCQDLQVYESLIKHLPPDGMKQMSSA
ncbi:hypothetical protein STEG23_005575, partial [Scotinomys teguina]